MKGSLFWKLMFLFCALTGMMAGYGIYALTGAKEIKQNSITKEAAEEATGVQEKSTPRLENAESRRTDSNPVQPAGEPGVSEVIPAPEQTIAPDQAIVSEQTIVPEQAIVSEQTIVPEQAIVSKQTIMPGQDSVSEKRTTAEQATEEKEKSGLPTVGSQWTNKANVREITVTPEPQAQEREEVITYPVKIFGQTPVINPSDAYVSYFEFCFDLVAMLEPKVQERGLNMNTLMTRFALKAFFCGVDVEKLDINAPIPKRLAALCLWLAAQVLNEKGCNTSATSAQEYVTDISDCSFSEKRAIAYLYEQGILPGYQVAGQQFSPADGLKTEDGTAWISNIERCWK